MKRRWQNWRDSIERSLLAQTLAVNVLPVVVSAACVLGLVLVFLMVQRETVEREMRMRARTVAESVAQQSELAAMMEDTAELGRIARRALELPDVKRLEIRTAQGGVASASDVEQPKPESLLELDAEILPSNAGPAMEWVAPDERLPLGWVRLSVSTERQRRLFHHVAWGGLGISGLVFAVIIYVQKRSLHGVLAPLGELVDFTRRVSRGELHHRARVVRRDEVGVLAQACNEMVASVQTSRAELETALYVAREASRLKSEFLANMSHELRTPLNGVIGMTDIALETALTDEQREYLSTVSGAARSLLSVLNDILDFSKIEAGRMDLERLDFNLHEELARAVKPFAAVAGAKGLELMFSAAPEAPEWLAGDPDRLRQILSNLLSNAIKFTASGEVVVTVNCFESNEDDCVLGFTVADTGIGVAQEKQDFIFDAFRQADGSTTRKYGGTGLGLAICSRLVEMMGGRIWVESELGQGSRFHFTARFGIGKGVPPGVEAARLDGLSVLVVDDNATNRRILCEYARRWGMTAEEAASGEAALEGIARSKRAGTPFPLVLVDALMPGMDGYQLAEQIALLDGCDETVVLMLSSSDLNCSAERRRASRIEHCLLKPIDRESLYEAITRALGLASYGNSREPCARMPDGSEGESASLSVLLVEDNAVNRAVGLRFIERLGYTATAVEDGLEAIAALERAKFDLVLMDVQMPGMDGFEATRAIREREAPAGLHTPIIAMTAHALKGDRERCLAQGMDGYVAKPVTRQELGREIRAVMQRFALPAR